MERIPRSIKERRIFLDTSAFLAIIDSSDNYHLNADAILQRLIDGGYRLYSTILVVAETHAGLISHAGLPTARRFLTEGVDLISMLRIKQGDLERAKSIILTYTDKQYSFCDATSFAVMERMNISLAFAYDNHFRQFRLNTPLNNPNWP